MELVVNQIPDYCIIGGLEFVKVHRDLRDGNELCRPKLAGCINNPRHYIPSKELSDKLNGFGWDNHGVTRGIRDISITKDQVGWLMSVITSDYKGYTLGIFNEEDCFCFLEQIPEDKRVLVTNRSEATGGDYLNSVVVPLDGRPV